MYAIRSYYVSEIALMFAEEFNIHFYIDPEYAWVEGANFPDNNNGKIKINSIDKSPNLNLILFGNFI